MMYVPLFKTVFCFNCFFVTLLLIMCKSRARLRRSLWFLVDVDETIVTQATIATDSVCVFGAPVVAFLSHINNIASILRPAFADSQQLWWCYA